MGYASDLSSIEEVLSELGGKARDRHKLQLVDLTDAAAVEAAVQEADPDLVMHLAAESHVDRSISGPGVFIESNVTHLQPPTGGAEPLRAGGERRDAFRMHHISTDEVFGSLGTEGRFSAQRPTPPQPLLRQGVITSFRPGTTPLVFLWCSPTAQTITAPGSSRKNSSPWSP